MLCELRIVTVPEQRSYLFVCVKCWQMHRVAR